MKVHYRMKENIDIFNILFHNQTISMAVSVCSLHPISDRFTNNLKHCSKINYLYKRLTEEIRRSII